MQKRFRKRKDQRNALLFQAFQKLEVQKQSKWQFIQDHSSMPTKSISNNSDIFIDWSIIDLCLQPSTGLLHDGARIERKQQQITSLLNHVRTALCAVNKTNESNPVCVEFGAGTGHAGLLLAYLEPGCQVILVERKEWTATVALERAKQAGLDNLTVFTGDVEMFSETADGHNFDVGFALHACGTLTDAVQNLCLQVGASYAIVPCCYGQVAKRGPRSTWLANTLLTEEFIALASASDFTVPADDLQFPSTHNFKTAKICMTVLDVDRNCFASERGFNTSLHSLIPLNCSPKNNILVGQPDFRSGLPEFYSFSPQDYSDTLLDKIDSIWTVFRCYLENSGFSRESIQVFASPKTNFRLRCRFQVMRFQGELQYVMWEKGKPCVLVKDFPIASTRICEAMPVLLQQVQKNCLLESNLQAVSFLSTLAGELAVTLIYQNKDLCDEWADQARLLTKAVSANITGRSKGIVRCIDTNIVHEQLQLKDGRTLFYQQIEGVFSNPNGAVNIMALDWLCEIASKISRAEQSSNNSTKPTLLELYCGNGNHTCALAPVFEDILAVELSSKLCSLAEENLARNQIHNVEVMQIQSERFSRMLKHGLQYFSKKTGKLYKFDAVLVDPPRAGLDKSTLELVKLCEHIVYISCDPVTALTRDLNELQYSHSIRSFAVFDQFAYTSHLECAIYATRIKC